MNLGTSKRRDTATLFQPTITFSFVATLKYLFVLFRHMFHSSAAVSVSATLLSCLYVQYPTCSGPMLYVLTEHLYRNEEAPSRLRDNLASPLPRSHNNLPIHCSETG